MISNLITINSTWKDVIETKFITAVKRNINDFHHDMSLVEKNTKLFLTTGSRRENTNLFLATSVETGFTVKKNDSMFNFYYQENLKRAIKSKKRTKKDKDNSIYKAINAEEIEVLKIKITKHYIVNSEFYNNFFIFNDQNNYPKIHSNNTDRSRAIIDSFFCNKLSKEQTWYLESELKNRKNILSSKKDLFFFKKINLDNNVNSIKNQLILNEIKKQKNINSKPLELNEKQNDNKHSVLLKYVKEQLDQQFMEIYESKTVKREYELFNKKIIDLIAYGLSDVYIFEFKTSYTEMLKAFGQVLYYESSLGDKFSKKNKIVVFSEVPNKIDPIQNKFCKDNNIKVIYENCFNENNDLISINVNNLVYKITKIIF